MALAYSTATLSIHSHVTPTDNYKPLTGVYSTASDIGGWKWDRRILENAQENNTRYLSTLGGQIVGLRDGTYRDQWQSSTASAGKYLGLAHYKNNELYTWTPVYETGIYNFFFDSRPLLSDYSFASIIRTENIVDGLMTHTLRADAAYDTINIAIYSRDSKYRVFQKKTFQYVDEFTGEIDTGTNTRLDTVNSNGDLIVANIASRKNEFIIDGDVVRLSGDHSIQVGNFTASGSYPTLPAEFIDEHWELAGTALDSGRDVFLKNFPIQYGSVSLVTLDPAGVSTAWTEVDSLDFSEPTDLHFKVDYDLGIIHTGGFEAPNLTISSTVEIADLEIEVYPDVDIDQYPQQGVIIIDNEEIAYYGRTNTVFLNCVRGFNNTSPGGHAKGSTVYDRKHGAGSNDEIYVSYTAVPRIQYEVTQHTQRSANKTPWLDLRPISNLDTNNIVQILSTDINLQQVILETDTPIIGSNLFGPVFYGSDVSRMTARGLDALGNPVEDIQLTIEIIEGPGRLNGFNTSYTNFTNTAGEIYAFYNTPYRKDLVEKFVSSVTHVGTDTHMTVAGLDDTRSAEEVWVYQIVKHDPVTGTVGLALDILAATTNSPPYGNGSITVDGLVSADDFREGWVYILGTDGVRYYRNITHVLTELDINDQPFSRIYIDAPIANGLVAGQTAWLFQPDAIEWVPGALNGSRVILYEWSDSVQHPITGEVGAYFPVRPDSISGNTLIFNNRQLPIPNKDDVANNLGGYAIITPSVASLQAWGRDPISGRVVQSNIIRLALELPSFLTGVDTTGALPIPYGWKLVTEEFNIGGAIGGANFLTINPAASGINQFSTYGAF